MLVLLSLLVAVSQVSGERSLHFLLALSQRLFNASPLLLLFLFGSPFLLSFAGRLFALNQKRLSHQHGKIGPSTKGLKSSLWNSEALIHEEKKKTKKTEYQKKKTYFALWGNNLLAFNRKVFERRINFLFLFLLLTFLIFLLLLFLLFLLVLFLFFGVLLGVLFSLPTSLPGVPPPLVSISVPLSLPVPVSIPVPIPISVPVPVPVSVPVPVPLPVSVPLPDAVSLARLVSISASLFFQLRTERKGH